MVRQGILAHMYSVYLYYTYSVYRQVRCHYSIVGPLMNTLDPTNRCKLPVWLYESNSCRISLGRVLTFLRELVPSHGLAPPMIQDPAHGTLARTEYLAVWDIFTPFL